MEDTWFFIDEDSSSNHSFSDSDAIDSETEAELYSVIHYEENLSNINCSASENRNVQMSKSPVSEKKNVFNSKDCDDSETKSTDNSMPISNNNDVNKTNMENEFSKTKFLNNLAQKLSTSAKRKSDSDHQLSDNSYESTSKCLSGHKAFFNELVSNKRQKNDHNEKNLNLTQSNCEDSNSSDSIIWTEVDSTENKNLQLNLCKEENEICLSSDSESDTLLSSNHKNLHLQNLSMPNMKITGNSKDKWHINDKDLFRQKRNKSRRYHDDFEVTCSNCNRKGHNARICPVPRDVKCFICGGNNHHGAVCVNRLCGHCGNYGHDRKRCLHPLKYCTLCNINGHSKENCPDLWRRYHLTTEPGIIIQARPMRDKLSYCWNCGRSGHFGAVCHEFQWYRPFYTTWPCVVSYKNPEKILKERLRSEQQNVRNNVRKNAQFNLINKSDIKVKVVVKTAEQLNNEKAERLKKRAEKKEKRKQMILQKKIQQQNSNIQVEREKDFPRTPKKKSTAISSEDTVPKVVDVLTKRKEKNRNRKRKRFLKRKQKLEARRQLIQVNTDNV